MASEREIAIGRRSFLRVLGVGATTTLTASLATEAEADSESYDEKRKARYKVTDDVKNFYRVNRYPS